MPADNDDGIDELREEYNNARERLNKQSSMFTEFAKEGQRMVRITLIYAGLVITGGSYVSSATDMNYFSNSSFVNGLLVLSGVFLMGSLVFHTMGREVRGVKTIYDSEKPRDNFQTKFDSTKEYYNVKISEYSDRIEYNEDVLDVFESNLGLAKGLLVGSVATAVFAVSLRVFDLSNILLAIIGIVALFLYLIKQFGEFPDEYYEKELNGADGLLYKITMLIQRLVK